MGTNNLRWWIGKYKMSISRLLNISSQGLAAYQQALAVTSHNIGNANNANFSRQRVVMTAQTSDGSQGNTLGSGVRMEDVTRVKSNMIDSQLRGYYSQNSLSAKQSSYLSQVESLISEPGDQGLSSMMNKFFNSWSELAVNPSSMPLRQNVVQSAQQMTNKIQSIYSGIQQMKPDLKAEADTSVAAINNSLTSIQNLNKQIYEAKITGNDASDLMDKRDETINGLSKLANISVSYNQENSANVSIGGIMAVDRFSAMQFQANIENGKLSINTSDGASSAALQGGELGAITDVYNNILPRLTNKLDETANRIMTQVNGMHSNGYNGQTPPVTGTNFFGKYENGALSINANILSDVRNIATSGDGTSGNNSIALQIAGLSTAKSSDGTTLNEFYAGFVNDLATTVQSADQTTSTSDMVMQQLENQKTSYSGVSVDEEMVNILKYQRGYDASAKLIKVANELFDTLFAVT